MLHRIELDWYGVLDNLTSNSSAKSAAARKTIQDGLTLIAPIFEKKTYFMSDDFSLIDCSLAPLLWRLSHYNIKLPAQAKPVLEYAERLFARESFQTSLTEIEKEIGN